MSKQHPNMTKCIHQVFINSGETSLLTLTTMQTQWWEVSAKARISSIMIWGRYLWQTSFLVTVKTEFENKKQTAVYYWYAIYHEELGLHLKSNLNVVEALIFLEENFSADQHDWHQGEHSTWIGNLFTRKRLSTQYATFNIFSKGWAIQNINSFHKITN